MTGRGTIKPYSGFNANDDAETIHKAIKHFGADDATILQLLTARSNAQRQQIKAAYKTLHGKDLAHELKSKLSGHFEDVTLALLQTPTMYDVDCLYHATKGAGTAEKVLIHILASRTCNEIQAINQAYKQEHGKTLEENVVDDTSGHFKQLLVILLQAHRQVGVQEDKIHSDAEALFKAGEKKFRTDEEQFVTILGNRSADHLRRVFVEYTKVSGFQIEESIKKETSGHLEELLLAVVMCAKSVPGYLADCLYHSMKGLGTDDKTLIEIMVSRSEIDMLDIRAEFRKRFSTSLYKMIKGDTSGDYEKTLLLLCGGDDA